MLILAERRIFEACEPSKKQCYFRYRGTLDTNVLHFFKNSSLFVTYAVCNASIVLSCDEHIACNSAGRRGICGDKWLRKVKC
jgi:hypothetical protein